MGWGERKYTDGQRAAVIYHRNVRKLSGKVISDLARRGELESVAGEPLGAFEIPKDSVYSLGRDDIARARRTEVSKLVTALPADANEAIRRRLVEIVDRRTAKLLEVARRGKEVDPEELRKLARAAREIAALPAYGMQAPQPGRQAAGAPEGETPTKSSAAAGAIFDAARGGAIAERINGPAQDDAQESAGEHGEQAPATTETGSDGAHGGDGQESDGDHEQDTGEGDGAGTHAHSQLAPISARIA
jgi:predicted RNA-binding Zn ribbon-like protein